MKIKFAIVALTILATTAFSPGAGVSAAPKASTDITGVVTNGTPVEGVKVTVVCDKHTQVRKTDSQGTYLVSYKATQCPDGSVVNVTAKSGKMSGVASGVVAGVTTKLNIAVVNVAVPEFGGIVGGLVAAAGAGGSFYLTRRTHLR